MRQLDALKQTGSVAEYYHRFEQLSHSILLYNTSYDDVFFVTRFLHGLEDEISAPIALHRPSNVDTACALALLQEEEFDRARQKRPFRNDSKELPKTGSRVFTTNDKLKPHIQKDDAKKADKSSIEDKWSVVRAYRRANGLYFLCAEKWEGKHHKCPPQVSINMIHEPMDLCNMQEGSDADSVSDEEETTDGMVMAVSTPTTQGSTKKRRTMRFRGFIGKQELLILPDSGSVGTFVSPKLIQQIQHPVVSCSPIQFTTADGGSMLSDTHIPNFQWFMQGHTFTYDTRILPSQDYDMILGANWLEDHSPMWIHWRQKKIRLPHNGKRIQLTGIRDELSQCTKISGHKLRGLLNRQAVSYCIQLTPIPSDPDETNSILAIAQEDSLAPSIQSLLDKFSELFHEPVDLPPLREYDHSIPLIPRAQPVNIRPYRYAPIQKSEIERQIREMLKTGVIQHSHSPFASPVLLVKKKDGTWRFCVDYRQLNNITVKNKHPMPVVDELLDELAGACWFTKLDFRAGYHQIRMTPGEEFKTAFKTHSGLYEFKVMPFGLTNAPASFQSVMNKIFAPLLRKSVLVFMDDILVYSKTLEEHLDHLSQVFGILQEHKFFIKRSKCVFAQQELEYLGHIISASGVATDPTKIQAVLNWPTPSNLKDLRGFLGLTGYYRRFIRHYGMLSRPLTQLLKKGIQFQWTSVAQDAFLLLKQALTQAPLLAVPNFSKQFILETEASDQGIGAVLMQDGHPISYLSKAFSEKNKALSTYDKECMAILLAVDKWRAYLQHQEFLIRTDHKSLLYLTDQRASTKLQQKALLKLMDLKFKIQYKKGSTNNAADALSRYPDSSSVMAISVNTPSWLENLQSGYADDAQAQQLLVELSLSSQNDKGFQLVNGIIKYKGRVWVGSNSLAQQHILEALHNSGIGGHSGFHATYHRVKSLFAWPKMKDTVKHFVQTCGICQQAKTEHVKTPGLLQPLEIPKQAWSTVSLDFIEGLPKSGSYTVILVVIDKFTKYGHFLPLAHPYSALTIAQLFLDNIYRLHGLPQAIVSDRDPIFTSALWRELFRLTDTKLLMSSSYHPQTDAQTERLNQCLEAFLRCTVHSCPRQWNKWLPIAEYWYNTAFQTSIGRTPFEVLYGYPPRHLGISNLQDCNVPDLETWLKERDLLAKLIQQQLCRAQQRMKAQADKNRSERQFEIGELVYLKLQPHVQSSVALCSNQKLAFRFFGPFKILQRVGNVAYKLQLPPTCLIHPVVHVSQLKRHIPPGHQVSEDLSVVHTDPMAVVEPVLVLDKAWVPHGAGTSSRSLI